MLITFNDIIKIRRPRPKYKIIKEIAKRWSPRYYSDKKIPLSHLKIIFEAARWTPSAHNRQPWYFYYVIKETGPYKILFSALNEYNQSWAKTTPIFILACAITKDKEGNNPFAFYDLGASVISLILQAQSLGYYAREMALFDKEKVKKFFKLEKNLEPFIIIALGKIGDYKTAPYEIVEMETDPRPRKTDLFKKLSL